MKKKYFLFLLLIYIFSWFTYSYVADCNNLSYYERLESKFKFDSFKIVNKNVYHTALMNLKKYCDDNSANVLSSPIFFNHIIDISFRKIDAIKWAGYGVKFDSKWLDWRTYLNNVAKDYNTDPRKISKKFKEFWWNGEQNMKANNETLYWKYLLACNEAMNIADKTITSSTKDDNYYPVTDDYFINSCKKLVKRRYEDEVRLVTKFVSLNLYHHISKTLHKWFNETFGKQNAKLLDKFMEINGNFEYVLRRFIHATDVK